MNPSEQDYRLRRSPVYPFADTPMSGPPRTIEGLAAWIDLVRSAAFLGGSRGDEISRAEAAALLPHLAAPVRRTSRSGIPITRRKV